jgi:hypothetical protein
MLVGNFDAKVIYHKAEKDVPPDVAPETRCVLALALVVPFGGKAFFKELICKDASLGKTTHPLLNILGKRWWLSNYSWSIDLN